MKSRNTMQKEIIKEAVHQMKTHPTAEELYKSIREKYPTISKATVYRNLTKMASKGEIKRVEMANSPDRFDFYTEPHYHFKCEACGKVMDIEVPYMEKLNTAPGEEMEVNGHEITFKGNCNKCKEKAFI